MKCHPRLGRKTLQFKAFSRLFADNRTTPTRSSKIKWTPKHDHGVFWSQLPKNTKVRMTFFFTTPPHGLKNSNGFLIVLPLNPKSSSTRLSLAVFPTRRAYASTLARGAGWAEVQARCGRPRRQRSRLLVKHIMHGGSDRRFVRQLCSGNYFARERVIGGDLPSVTAANAITRP